MADITYTPFADNTEIRAKDVYDKLYLPNGDSFEVINGHLDRANLDPNFLVDYHALQANSVSGAGVVSATANMDFFGGTSDNIQGWFDGVTSPADEENNTFLPIPGAAVQFYVPYPATVLLTWQVNWVSDSLGAASVLRLFFDGQKKASSQARRIQQTMFPAADGETFYLRDRYKSRYWCGHELYTDVAKGYHSASLRLCGEENVKQTRVRARSMKYIIFKRSDS